MAARNSELAVSVGGEPALCFLRHLQQADTNRKQCQEVIAFLSSRDFWTLSPRSASQVSGWPCSPYLALQPTAPPHVRCAPGKANGVQTGQSHSSFSAGVHAWAQGGLTSTEG